MKRKRAAGSLIMLALIAFTGWAFVRSHPPRVLRVCADPNNLPFSNEKLEGFENKLADILAEDLGARVQYTWFAQRRGFIRNTLRARDCDVVMGVPTSFELAASTRPYYRSTYVFVTRTRDRLTIKSLDDAVLRTVRIGVHLVGDDYSNTPPAHALSARGIIDNVRGYTLYGDYNSPNPPADILKALVDREIDVAIVWGPLAGYFAQHLREPLTLTPVSPQVDVPFLPMVFDIGVGVRREDTMLKERIEAVLERRRHEVDVLLDEYGVPRIDGGFAQ
jgi:mxaJ protein